MKRNGRSKGEMRRSGVVSVLFSQESFSISFDQPKVATTCKPCEKRCSARTLRLLKFELPKLPLRMVTPELKLVESATGNSGNGTNNCRTAMLAPLKLLTAGISPWNGLGTVPVRRVFSA